MRLKNLESAARLVKPCPLCGGETIKRSTKSFYLKNACTINSVYIECENCDLRLTNYVETTVSYNTAMRDCVKRWNRRAKTCRQMRSSEWSWIVSGKMPPPLPSS